MEQENLISIDGPKSKFEAFLSEEKNRRIFFSGKFGCGKTFFLQTFFDGFKEKYDVYHLYPVRYQISSNENIINLLKYDILVELLKKDPECFQGNVSKGIKDSTRLFLSFCKERGSINSTLQSIVGTTEAALSLSPDPLVQALSKLGRPIKDLLVFDRKFQEFKREFQAGDKGVIDKFIKEIELSDDSIATDHLSHLLIEKIKNNKAGKRSVLILDDFDRIDPEHIFRILNVLSAQMEGEEDNKFGFDHIIIVADIKNVESIFHHRYGESTEFGGYFDKFFTVKPFEFDNKKAVIEKIPDLIQKIKYDEPNLKDALGRSGITKHLLEEVLLKAFDLGHVSLRQLYKPIQHKFVEVQKGALIRDSFMDGRNQCIDIAIKLLIALYGNKETFLKVLRSVRANASSSDDKGQWLFSEYSNSMLKRLIPKGTNENSDWLTYKIKRTQNGWYLNEGDRSAHARFFYDTLVEYVERGKYDKQNWRDYDD
ncbi:MAG: hypothetical protein HZA81_03350 [Candidatus Taylorbacteria bacterium]|nr:hypothetical protein [Candidatus Taylorbacteria bacterium]